ncbi:ribosome maturation factor RimP [Arthrobacter sp. MDT1-65]
MSVLLVDNIIEWEAAMAVRSGNEKHASTRKSAVEAELQVEAQRLRTRLQPVVEEHDLYLEDVEVKVAGSHRTVHVVVDLPEDATGSVGLDVISAISSDLSAAMDSDPEDDDRPYSLEISSPGVSRPLTEPRHWRRNVGRMVEVKPVTGDVVVGRLQDVTATGIRMIPQLPVKKGMKPKQGDPLALEFSRIRKGTVQVEFAHPEDEHHENSDGAEPDDSGAVHHA